MTEEMTFDQMLIQAHARWREGLPLRQVAMRYQMTTRSLKEYLLQSGLLGSEHADPSPAEIRRRAAAIRSEWDEETRMNRWIGLRQDDAGLV